MNQSANEPSGDSPPAAVTADRLREQIREHMERKNQAIFDDLLRERSSTAVPRSDIAPPEKPMPASYPKPAPVPIKRRRPRLRPADFDKVLDMAALGHHNVDIAEELDINKNAVSLARSGRYRGMTEKQRKRARKIERDRGNSAEASGCRPMDLPPNLSPAQVFERDAKAAKTLYTLHEGHPLAGKSPPPVTDDKPQLSVASQPPPSDERVFPPHILVKEPREPTDPIHFNAVRIDIDQDPPSQGDRVGSVLDLLDRQQRQQAEVISDLVAQVRGLLK